MRSLITGTLFSLSLLTAWVVPAVAQELSPNTMIVDSGSDLRCKLDKGLRITRAGEPITARLVEPVYVGTVLAIPKGSRIKGRVSTVSTAPWSKRTGRLLNGDFTPPRVAHVTFDNLVLSDGNSLPIHTGATVGISGVKTAKYLPNLNGLRSRPDERRGWAGPGTKQVATTSRSSSQESAVSS